MLGKMYQAVNSKKANIVFVSVLLFCGLTYSYLALQRSWTSCQYWQAVTLSYRT